MAGAWIVYVSPVGVPAVVTTGVPPGTVLSWNEVAPFVATM